jgi:hypothetical protein
MKKLKIWFLNTICFEKSSEVIFVKVLDNFTTNNLKEVMLVIKEQEHSDIDSIEVINFIKKVILDICNDKE